MAVTVVAIVVLFAAYEAVTGVLAYTSDAYVQSDLVAIAPQVSGRIVAVHVLDNQAVAVGDRLASIDPVPFTLAADQRRAEMNQAAAQVAADADMVTSAQAALAGANAALADRATAVIAQRQSASARDVAAHAAAVLALATAEWELSQTELLAPAAGTVTDLTLRVGDTATVGVALIGIVDAAAWRIVANYKQGYLRAFAPGDTAYVWLDARPWHLHPARVAGIARGISRDPAPGRLLSYVAPTTDWIRLQRRFPVTLTLVDPPADLKLYMGSDARVLILP